MRSLIEEVESRRSLGDSVRAYVRLRKAGRNWIGLCPFHTEKSPSFSLLGPSFEKFHCYGCGAHGDLIDFESAMRRATITETLRALADELGIERPEESPAQRLARQERRRREQQLAGEADLFWGRVRAAVAREQNRFYREERALSRQLQPNVEDDLELELAALKACEMAAAQTGRLLQTLDWLERNDTSVHSERLILGAILSGHLPYSTVAETLSRDDFQSPRHRAIFKAAGELDAEGKPATLPSVAAKLLAETDLSAPGPFVRMERTRRGERPVLCLFDALLSLTDDAGVIGDEGYYKWRMELVKANRRATVDRYRQLAQANPGLRERIRKQIDTDIDDAAFMIALVAMRDRSHGKEMAA
jgi:hypothetical protein